MNLSKTKYIWENIALRNIKLKNGVFNKVNDYKYLGSWLEN